jgi:hypothetical protein
MHQHTIGTRLPTILTTALLLLACGPKTPHPDSPDKVEDDGTGTTKTKSGGPSKLAKLVDRLNASIQDGNEAEATAIIESDTLDMLVEAMGILPEWEPAGEEFAIIDYLDWEKERGVTFILEDEDTENDAGTLIGQINGLDEFEGKVSLVGEGDGAQMEFYNLAGMIRDEILSKGLQREKYIAIVDNINKSIAETDTKLFQNSLTLDTLNAELKIISYETKKKSNWSIKGILQRMKNQGFKYSVSKLDVDSGEAMLKVIDSKDDVVLEGDMIFKSEVGFLKLDYLTLL